MWSYQNNTERLKLQWDWIEIAMGLSDFNGKFLGFQVLDGFQWVTVRGCSYFRRISVGEICPDSTGFWRKICNGQTYQPPGLNKMWTIAFSESRPRITLEVTRTKNSNASSRIMGKCNNPKIKLTNILPEYAIYDGTKKIEFISRLWREIRINFLTRERCGFSPVSVRIGRCISHREQRPDTNRCTMHFLKARQNCINSEITIQKLFPGTYQCLRNAAHRSCMFNSIIAHALACGLLDTIFDGFFGKSACESVATLNR